MLLALDLCYHSINMLNHSDCFSYCLPSLQCRGKISLGHCEQLFNAVEFSLLLFVEKFDINASEEHWYISALLPPPPPPPLLFPLHSILILDLSMGNASFVK